MNESMQEQPNLSFAVYLLFTCYLPNPRLEFKLDGNYVTSKQRTGKSASSTVASLATTHDFYTRCVVWSAEQLTSAKSKKNRQQ